MKRMFDGLPVIPPRGLATATPDVRYQHPHKRSAKAERRVVCPPGVACWHDQCHDLTVLAAL